MSRHYLISILVVGLLALGGWVFAQQERPVAKAPAPEGGQFVVSPAGDTAVLLETKSGRTWVLRRSVEDHSVWLPAKRIDSEQEVRRWLEEEEVMKHEVAKRAKARKQGSE